ncbi:MAG: hypothetical protein IJU50_05150, partial [Lachnospiraceae bacterium]|nr:hypothetical protein [Lachnospiraceae bacterium]
MKGQMGFNPLRWKRIIIYAFILALAAGSLPLVASADERSDAIEALQQREQQTQQAITDLQKQTKETQDAIRSLEGQKEETIGNVNNLEHQSSQLQTAINGYSSQLQGLSEEITEAENNMAEISARIVQLDQELQEAREQEQTRYKALKKRIQGFYESGGIGGMLELLLECGSMREVFTKTEYLRAVVRYDYKKIQEFQVLQEEIEAKVAVVREQEAELDAYQTTLDEKHAELAQLTDSVKGQLRQTKNTMSSEMEKLENYDQMLVKLDAQMKALEAQTAAAQAELARQIAERLALQKEDTSGAYV